MFDGKDEVITKFFIVFCSVPYLGLLPSELPRGTNGDARVTVADAQNAGANWNDFIFVSQKS